MGRQTFFGNGIELPSEQLVNACYPEITWLGDDDVPFCFAPSKDTEGIPDMNAHFGLFST